MIQDHRVVLGGKSLARSEPTLPDARCESVLVVATGPAPVADFDDSTGNVARIAREGPAHRVALRLGPLNAAAPDDL